MLVHGLLGRGLRLPGWLLAVLVTCTAPPCCRVWGQVNEHCLAIIKRKPRTQHVAILEIADVVEAVLTTVRELAVGIATGAQGVAQRTRAAGRPRWWIDDAGAVAFGHLGNVVGILHIDGQAPEPAGTVQ